MLATAATGPPLRTASGDGSALETAAGHAAGAAALARDHDGRLLFALQALDFFHGFLNGAGCGFGKLAGSLAKARTLELEAQRQGAGRRHHLGLADVEHGASRVAAAITGNRRQAADGAGFLVGENLFAVKLVRVHRQLVQSVVLVHVCNRYG